MFHGATPETDDTCFYFWMRANSLPDDPRSTEVILKEIAAVLSQDIAILEAQNDRMMADLDRRLVDLKNDSQRIMARRAVDRMIAAEQADMRWPRRSDPAIDEGRALPPSPSGYPMIALYPSVPMK